jgi:hypothetical protein
MGGRLATYEDSREVFLRGCISSNRGRSYSTLQKLDSSPLLPSSVSGGHSKLTRRRDFFDYWIQRRLFGDGFRPAREEIRPVGR